MRPGADFAIFLFWCYKNHSLLLRFLQLPNWEGKCQDTRLSERLEASSHSHINVHVTVCMSSPNGTSIKRKKEWQRVNLRPTRGHKGPEQELRYISIISLSSALDGSRWSVPYPGCFVPGKQKKDPFSMGQGGTQDRSGWAQKISPPT